MTRKIVWRRIDANPKWLLGYIPRNPYPTSFTQAMMPDRNARYDDIRPMLAWCDEHNIKVDFLTGGMLAFDDEKYISLFLMRWS